MVVSALHVQDGATLLVDGRKVPGSIVEAGEDLIEVRFAELPPKGMRMLQVLNPGSYLSNEFIFFVETREEAVARHRRSPQDTKRRRAPKPPGQRLTPAPCPADRLRRLARGAA